MKKKFCFVLISLFFIVNFVQAKKVPDPLYLNSEVMDMDVEAQKKLEKEQKKQEKKEKKIQKKREKLKAKNRIPKRYEYIDKSETPITMEDYEKFSKEKLREDYEIPSPQFEEDKDFIYPEPQFRVVSYNSPPGQRNIDLTKISSKRSVASPAILSADKTKMVYTKSFYYPQTTQTASAAYYIPIKNSAREAYDILFNTNIIEGSTKPIFTTGDEHLQKFQFKVLFPLDFSKDSKKLAFKEKIGSNMTGTWITNIMVYDFEQESVIRLSAVREAIIYYWRQKGIELKDYMWDIYPVGWDKNNPDRIIVKAYAYTSNQPYFLGTWSIDDKEMRSELISTDSDEADIDLNGFGLFEVKLQH